MARFFIYDNSGSINDTISDLYSGKGNRFDSLFEVLDYLANRYSLDPNSFYLRYYTYDLRIPAHVYMISHRDQSNSFSFLSFLVEVYF